MKNVTSIEGGKAKEEPKTDTDLLVDLAVELDAHGFSEDLIAEAMRCFVSLKQGPQSPLFFEY